MTSQTQARIVPMIEYLLAQQGNGGLLPPTPPLPPTPGDRFNNTPDDDFNAFIDRLGGCFDRLHLSLTRQQWTKLIISLREAWGVQE